MFIFTQVQVFMELRAQVLLARVGAGSAAQEHEATIRPFDAINFVMLQQLHWKVDRLREWLDPGTQAVPGAALPADGVVTSEEMIRVDAWVL